MLFPWALQVELHRELQAAGAQSSLWKLDSVYGHDAFLADQDRLAELLRGAGAFGGEPRVGAAAALRRRRRRAGARAAHRPGRLRHGRPRAARDDRAAAAPRSPIATACASACRGSRCATSPRIAAPRAAGIPLTDRPLELVSDPDVDVVVEVAGGTAMEPILTRGARRGQAGRHRQQGAARVEARRARRARAAHRDAALLRGRRRGGAADPPPSESSRRRDRQPVPASSTAPATS